MPKEWKELLILPIHKKGNKTDCSNYRDISLLPTTYKILSNIQLARLAPYAEEIIWDHQCGFRHNMSTPEHTFCILYSSPSIGRVIKSTNIRQAEHVARMGDRRGVCRALVGKSEGNPGTDERILLRWIFRK